MSFSSGYVVDSPLEAHLLIDGLGRLTRDWGFFSGENLESYCFYEAGIDAVMFYGVLEGFNPEFYVRFGWC